LVRKTSGRLLVYGVFATHSEATQVRARLRAVGAPCAVEQALATDVSGLVRPET
jgi:hypothetical protein